MPPAAPHPTRMRRSPRRSRKAMPMREAMPLAELRIAGLEADRGADPARPHRLRRDDDAADEATCGRHAAHWPRSGRPRAPRRQRPISSTRSAETRCRQTKARRTQPQGSSLMAADSRSRRRQAERTAGAGYRHRNAHGRHDQAGDGPDHRRQARSGSIPAPAPWRGAGEVSQMAPLAWKSGWSAARRRGPDGELSARGGVSIRF